MSSTEHTPWHETPEAAVYRAREAEVAKAGSASAAIDALVAERDALQRELSLVQAAQEADAEVLRILENTPDWSPDTLEEIAQEASACQFTVDDAVVFTRSTLAELCSKDVGVQ